ncbi:hypothetical protein [Cupriavidus basilensis]|uniref:hypothetical protein n=1 Tax=Cupriavidus basilensis TaxID=68895 RepID=UPI002842EF98|nr:hypothetical protein [Cupriavidus basilensis]MDR3382299.1 hypothetical protein [Cupriavidus basilensis]
MATVGVDVSSVVQGFGLQHRQMPFAVATTLTRLARLAREAETTEIVRAFDNPVPFTRSAVGTTSASKASLESSVFIKDRQARYLRTEVEGGQRELKTFEKLFGRGIALPGTGAKLNQYGNLTRATIKRIAAELNSSGTSKRYFMGKPRGHNLPEAIYARVDGNSKIVPLLVFTTRAQYEKRLRFSEVAELTARANFEREMLQAWEQALATAR